MLHSKKPVMLSESCPPKQNESHGEAVIGRSEELKELLNRNLEKNEHGKPSCSNNFIHRLLLLNKTGFIY